MDEGWERWFLAWSGEVCVDVLAEVWRRMKVGEGWTSNCYTSGWTKWLPPPHSSLRGELKHHTGSVGPQFVSYCLQFKRHVSLTLGIFFRIM